MPINRVATSSMHQQNLKDISLDQQNLAKLNKQISSGLKASNYAELNGAVERVSGYESKLSAIKTHLSNNNSIEARLNVMDQSVTQLQDIAEDFASLIAMRRNPATANGLNFQAQAKALMASAAQTLNISVEGRYLFSGSKTDTPPIATPVPSNTTVGVSDANYYRGNSDVLNARVSDSLEIPYGITGNDQAFQDLFSAINTALQGDAGNSDAILQKAVDQINAAVDGLASVRAGIGSQISNLQDVNEQHEQLQVYWKQAVSNDTSTDIAEASIQLATDQTVLQATFQAFANLSRLRLTDFLN